MLLHCWFPGVYIVACTAGDERVNTCCNWSNGFLTISLAAVKIWSRDNYIYGGSGGRREFAEWDK